MENNDFVQLYINKIFDELNEANKQRIVLLATNEANRQDYEKLSAEHATALEEIARLNGIMSNFTMANEELGKTVTNLRERISSDKSNLENELATVISQRTSLQGEANELRARCSALEGEIESLKAKKKKKNTS